MNKKLLYLLTVLIVSAASAFDVVPQSPFVTEIDMNITGEYWSNALKYDNFHAWKSKEYSKQRSRTRFYQDKNNFYIILGFRDEDIPAMVRNQEKDRHNPAWKNFGAEIFFTNQKGGLTQVAVDYLGNVYKTFPNPVFAKVEVYPQASSYIVFVGIPMKAIVRETYDEVISVNVYRKSPSGTSSLYPNEKGVSFKDVTSVVLLRTRERIMEDHSRAVANDLEDARREKLISEDVYQSLNAELRDAVSGGAKADSIDELAKNLNKLTELRKLLSEKKNSAIKKNTGK